MKSPFHWHRIDTNHAAFLIASSFPLALHRRKGRAMKTPIEFDYDLWREEEKYMVRVKRTGEVCEVDADTMRMLRAEEKRLRRSMQGAPVAGSGERETVLSLDYASADESGEMTPAWLEDPANVENITVDKLLFSELLESLTEKQRELFTSCIQNGISLREFARSKRIDFKSARERMERIQKKYIKIFE